jgi:hypothetical protein
VSTEKTSPTAECDAAVNGERCGKPAIWSGPCPVCECNPKIHLCSDHYDKWQGRIDSRGWHGTAREPGDNNRYR